LSVPVGMAEANREVKVVVESIKPALKKASEMTQEEWKKFIAETAGSWRGELERPEQGEFETRDQWPWCTCPTRTLWIAYIRREEAALLQRFQQVSPADIAICSVVLAELLYYYFVLLSVVT